jgi:hypothetical protein
MTRSALTRRLCHLETRVPAGCPVCRTEPVIVILHGDEPEPPDICPACGQVYPFRRIIRLVRVERGPQ